MTLIQIHLMLIFIRHLHPDWLEVIYSNTSHVNLYRCTSVTVRSGMPIQIHLMLIFISLIASSLLKAVGIQIHLMLIFIYPARDTVGNISKFKYISC